jgi:hypothetical protein
MEGKGDRGMGQGTGIRGEGRVMEEKGIGGVRRKGG